MNVLFRGSSNHVPTPIDAITQNIGYHSNKQRELRKLRTTPCPLQVPPAVPYYGATYGQTKDVVLDQCRSEEGPWISEACGGYEDEIRDRVARASEIVCGFAC